eukprot:3312636-Alexandrium_andersonii.AAC.1
MTSSKTDVRAVTLTEVKRKSPSSSLPSRAPASLPAAALWHGATLPGLPPSACCNLRLTARS